MNRNKPYRIILSGGGTGGHIFPALAVANFIRDTQDSAEFLFVGANGKMEMTKIPEAGYKIIGLNISGLQRRLTLENLLFPLKVISSYLASLKILKEFKPDVVVGFGGYASSPITLAAARKKVPILLQEQNSHAGLANKAVAKRASIICVAYHDMDVYFDPEKITLTGNPVRDNILQTNLTRTEAEQKFGLTGRVKTILVLGGSLGARTINESIVQNIDKIMADEVNMIWQTGSLYYQEMVERAGTDKKNICQIEFISDMGLAYKAADLVISRAGALTISELCIVGKPVIFVPSPNVAEDHQTKNAMSLVDQEAAEMVADNDAVAQLVDKALELLKNNDRLEVLSKNIGSLALPHATRNIADKVLSLIR